MRRTKKETRKEFRYTKTKNKRYLNIIWSIADLFPEAHVGNTKGKLAAH